MAKHQDNRSVFSILRIVFDTLLENKVIFFPFIVVIFFQLLALELIYFSFQPPLNVFFGPIIDKLWSSDFLHYPLNFLLIPKFYQYVQMPIYVFVSSFCLGMAILIVHQVNSDIKVKVGKVFQNVWESYVHLFFAAFLSLGVLLSFLKFYQSLLEKVTAFSSEEAGFLVLKKIVVVGAPFFSLLLSVFVTVVFAYFFIVIIVEKKKFFPALFLNLRLVFKHFFPTFLIVFIPSLLYIPMLFLRSDRLFDPAIPELKMIGVVLSIFFVAIIDALIYTALTIFYLLKKEPLLSLEE